MNENEKLIEEARRSVLTMDYERAYQGGLVGRLADALEAAEGREPEPQGEPSDASECEHCGGEAWHHTVECFTGAAPAQEAVARLENCLENREAGIGAWSMVQPEDVRTVLAALRAAGAVR